MNDLLNQRETTHGDFRRTASTAQRIKAALEDGEAWAWNDMSPVMRESLHLIATKLARIVEGDPCEMDHWTDLIGYSQLVLVYLNKQADHGTKPDH